MGILWFFIYMRTPSSNYRVSPIDEFWERTESFERLSRENRHFLKQFGDFFMSAEHKATYMTGKLYGGYTAFDAQSIPGITSVTCDQGMPGVVSLFEADGDKYVCIVNNSPFESGMFKVRFTSKVKTIERLSWNGLRDMKRDHWDAFYGNEGDETICGDWCAPGQMQVYRFK